jgi:hypothetical protein
MAGGVPPAAKAEIVINERIGKVALSMTDDQVRARLGRADDITYRSQDFGGPSKTYWYFGRLIVKFYDIEAPRVAWSITTPSQRQRTASGLGVGSRVNGVSSAEDAASVMSSAVNGLVEGRSSSSGATASRA